MVWLLTKFALSDLLMRGIIMDSIISGFSDSVLSCWGKIFIIVWIVLFCVFLFYTYYYILQNIKFCTV